MNYPFASLVRVGIILSIFVLLLSISLFSLTEIPPTWMDEGAIIQVAMNLSEQGIYGYQIAPGNLISAEFLTTGYPVIYPVALSFLVFGKSLFAARFVMVLFMFSLLVSVYWYSRLLSTREDSDYFFPIMALLLLVSFPPLYGHGKNVLGEVPGLTFFMFSLISLLIFERGNRSQWLLLISGVFSGLSMATKPLYLILILPPTLFSFFLLSRNSFSYKEKGILLLGTLAPLAWWVLVQSGDGSVWSIFSYGNPNNTPLVDLVIKNSVRFLTEFSPAYFLGLLFLWWGGVALRRKRGIPISTAESIALGFSVLNLLSFLTTRGFYRYLLPSEILALLFLPYTLYSGVRLKLAHREALLGSISLILILVGIQGYQLLFSSWVSDSHGSERTALLTRELGSIDQGQSVFFYHVPEAVPFLSHRNYYQYLNFADSVQRGSESLPLLQQGRVDLILVDDRFSTSTFPLDYYKEKSQFDKYTLYEKK